LARKQQYSRHPITAFFALAAPVNTNQYLPPMKVIQRFYNFFSCNDFVQPVMGIFGRVYPKHPRIANIRLFINDLEPDHTQMHDPLIAQCVPSLPLFNWSRDYVIKLYERKSPIMMIDHNRADILAQDEELIRHLGEVLTRQQLVDEP
jgi:hypothetical protein